MRPTFTLRDFVTESNRIEGLGPAKPHEVKAHERLLAAPVVTVRLLEDFVAVVAPGATLRRNAGMNVRVGNHMPPPGGRFVEEALEGVLRGPWKNPYEQHLMYETLHPFMDGNGRSGRALWLWAMGGIERAPLGFLHHFYYQTLNQSSGRRPTPSTTEPRND